ncbi:MAG: zinc-binding dehydrogenase, partial [Anaerolineae bacterium]|jgi:NADPH:quinone reductase-like Zn-dependent oxidoreductase|nr:zinc-binding dehydrogenase [Anaerolineae bacterium]
VRSIGADHVIDYTKTDFTKTGQQYDLIYDAKGNRSVADFQRALKPNGMAIMAGFTTLWHMIRFNIGSKRVSKRGTQKIGIMPTATRAKADLLILKDMIEAGKITPIIDRCYPFSELPQAVAYVEKGHARGKVVVTVSS